MLAAEAGHQTSGAGRSSLAEDLGLLEAHLEQSCLLRGRPGGPRAVTVFSASCATHGTNLQKPPERVCNCPLPDYFLILNSSKHDPFFPMESDF